MASLVCDVDRWLIGRVSALHSVVAGSISRGKSWYTLLLRPNKVETVVSYDARNSLSDFLDTVRLFNTEIRPFFSSNLMVSINNSYLKIIIIIIIIITGTVYLYTRKLRYKRIPLCQPERLDLKIVIEWILLFQSLKKKKRERKKNKKRDKYLHLARKL